MSENPVLSAAQIACFAVISLSCGSSSSPPDAAPSDARVDAAADSELRQDFCGYWPLDPGPSCGEALYGSVEACLQAIEPCDDSDLLGVGFCWETADERCDAECLPACAEDHPGRAARSLVLPLYPVGVTTTGPARAPSAARRAGP